MAAVPPQTIRTDRLVLRPTQAGDAERAFEIQSDWSVARMLSMASFPPNRDEIRRWFANHAREWRHGTAFRFAVEHKTRLIGIVDIDGVAGSHASLGYWFERAAGGRGLGLEAASAATDFAFEVVGLSRLTAGHAFDNPASGRILKRLGFTPLDTVEMFSRPRGQTIKQRRYKLDGPRIRR